MEFVQLTTIEKKNNRIVYIFRTSSGLNKYFNDYPYYIDYTECIELVPDGIAVIPFITNLLQIIWLTDSELIIPELDYSFYKCIPNIKKGFEEMYPDATFGGKLSIQKIVDYKLKNNSGTAVFYSGGLDSAVSMLRHLNSNLHLISIWGSDVDCENESGWKVVENGIIEIAQQFNLPQVTIRSAFRRFDNTLNLTHDFEKVLCTTWWYGVKHGIGIIGHAAPYAWLHGIGTIYMASSNCVRDGKQRCASAPTIDGCVRFFGCKIVHDGFELTRQDKTAFLIAKCSEENKQLHLHVCWKSATGDNCCFCEKCYRTMVGIWIEGADPRDFGFTYDAKVFRRIYQLVALRQQGLPGRTWTYMREQLKDNWEQLPKKVRSGLKWMLDFNFLDEESNKCRKKYEATWRIKKRIVSLFPHLYKLYITLRGYRFE